MNIELLFESTLRSFLGDKAYHIAGQTHSEKYRKEWYRKVLRKISKRIARIETNAKHKQQLEFWCNRLLELASERSLNELAFTLSLFRLTGSLLGYISLRGSCLVTPAYFQRTEQYYTQDILLNDGDALQSYYDRKSATATRARIARQLRAEGMSDFHISLVLNSSEGHVKRLRREL